MALMASATPVAEIKWNTAGVGYWSHKEVMPDIPAETSDSSVGQGQGKPTPEPLTLLGQSHLLVCFQFSFQLDSL